MITAGTEQKIQEALTMGQHVIREESRALQVLADTLDGDFTRAVELMAGSKGRVGVTGIGKSGHIGRKISATLNSTGTPSYFVHPSEASHGDLGCVGREDLILALSNSGESYELSDILSYAARRDIPIVSITSKRDSFLGRQSKVVLVLPDVGEAGPLGCAPTTSTTLTLAMGDALAMSLLQLRGFTTEDFAHFHPGGQLGRKLMLVGDIMHTGDALPLAGPSMKMDEALCIITGKGFGCLGITDNGQADGKLIGLVADGDLRRNMNAHLLDMTTGDIMTPDPVTIDAAAPAAKALGIMNKKRITSIMVVDEAQRIAGLVHMHDCLRAGIE